MLTEERKAQIIAEVEYSVNKHLSKQDIVNEAIYGGNYDGEEEEFLRECNWWFEMVE